MTGALPAPLPAGGLRRLSLSAFFVFAEAGLAALTDVKLGPVQLAEALGLAMLPFVAWDVAGWRAGAGRPGPGWKPRWFAAFLLAAALGALIAGLRERFVIPADATSALKQPGWISAARLVQFGLAFCTAALLARACTRWRGVFENGLRAYAAAATASSAYGLASYAALRFAHVALGGAYDTGDGVVRLRSFFVEGGPFGLYALSGLIVLFTLRRRRLIGARAAAAAAATIAAAFLLSQSKAATLAGVLDIALAAVLGSPGLLRRYWKPLLAAALAAAASAAMTDLPTVFGVLLDRREQLEATPGLFGDDPNILMGRIAGAIIVPAMIWQHPLLGVGIGNYSLLRDSPLYNPILPAANAWDLHGLGLYGFMAEVGFVGVVALAGLMLAPALAARRLGQAIDVAALALYPILALLFGVQPTFLYPWVLFAFAVASVQPSNRPA
jgi:hypothetical protein